MLNNRIGQFEPTRIVVLLQALLLAACAMADPAAPEEPAESADLQSCPDTRPQMCTMDYRPVCGRLQDGSERTYSNACTACSHAEVSAWRADACDDEESASGNS